MKGDLISGTRKETHKNTKWLKETHKNTKWLSVFSIKSIRESGDCLNRCHCFTWR